MRPSATTCLALTLLATGCGEGEGTLVVTAYGEDFIEEGIGADAVADGWSVTFDRFEVTIAEVVAAEEAVAVTGSIDVAQPSSGAGHRLGSVAVAEGDYTDASFTIERVEVDGRASQGGQDKTFHWIFDEPTHYQGCETTTSVPDGGEGTFEITIHGDHLLYDSLVGAEPELLFQALADADADADGAISPAELAATDIGAYDPGSEGGIDDLWAWLTALAHTLGHVDGEGHCHTGLAGH